MIELLISKRLSLEIKFIYLVFADLLKCFSNWVLSIEGCFVILRFQKTFSIEEYKEGFGNSNDLANCLDFTAYTSFSVRTMISNCTSDNFNADFFTKLFKIGR